MSPTGRRLRIKLSTSFPEWPVEQQLPSCGIWENAEFFINQPVAECDAWFVYEGLTTEDSTICPAGSVTFLTAEPSSFKRYHRGWLRGFDRVITSQHDLRHPVVTHTQTGLPWLLRRSFDELLPFPSVQKTGDISVISSTKTTTRGHRQRLAFVRELARQVPVEVFGRGFRSLEDKWEGLAPFRFSIAIENSRHEHYWTEKFADCVLAGTVPVYHGCPNIQDYFSPDAYLKLDIHDVPTAIQTVKNLLVDAPVEYDRRLPALVEARRLVLHEYNLFNLITHLATADATAPRAKEKRTLKPEPQPGWLKKRWTRACRKWF
jgi:hypothetical protein